MPTRFKLLLAFGGASSAGLFAYLLWNPRAGLAVFISLLAGIALGRFSSGSTSEDIAPSQVSAPRAKASSAMAQAPASAWLEAMMNGMREGVLVVDEAMRVVASNSAARSIFKRHEGTPEGVRITSLTRNFAVHTAFRAALENGLRTEVKIELLGEERRAFDMRVVPLQAGRGHGSRGAIGVFFDITRLERLERVRQEFLSNVSHELRTPLTSIIAFVETLEEGAIHDPMNRGRFLSVIRKNAARMHHLIDDILELSSIEAGTVTLKMERVRLRPIVADIMGTLAVRAEARRVRLCNKISADATINADPRRLEQMLTNLIDNAIKFNREKGSVTITCESGTRDRIHISDTGEGIPGEHVERIFERFYRVDRARSPENGGTGLGLAIVKHLARAHGGEVSVHSIANEGSTFIIELPALEQSVRDVA